MIQADVVSGKGNGVAGAAPDPFAADIAPIALPVKGAMDIGILPIGTQRNHFLSNVTFIVLFIWYSDVDHSKYASAARKMLTLVASYDILNLSTSIFDYPSNFVSSLYDYSSNLSRASEATFLTFVNSIKISGGEFMFFEQFSKLCQEAGVSVYKACTDVGLNRSAVAKWKAGATPNGATAARLAEYFGVSVGYLLGREDPPRRPHVSDEDIKFALFGGDGEITDAMFDEVKRFAAFLKKQEQEKFTTKE